MNRIDLAAVDGLDLLGRNVDHDIAAAEVLGIFGNARDIGADGPQPLFGGYVQLRQCRTVDGAGHRQAVIGLKALNRTFGGRCIDLGEFAGRRLGAQITLDQKTLVQGANRLAAGAFLQLARRHFGPAASRDNRCILVGYGLHAGGTVEGQERADRTIVDNARICCCLAAGHAVPGPVLLQADIGAGEFLAEHVAGGFFAAGVSQ